MSTSPANGSSLSFLKTLVTRSSTASLTINNTSTIAPGPPPTLGGGGFSGAFPAASGPFSPKTSHTFNLSVPFGASAPYTFLLPSKIVAVDGGQSSVSQVYTFAPTARGTFNVPITFTPSAGWQGTPPSSTVTLSGQGVAPVISLDSSAAAVGNIRIGTSGSAALTIRNVGDGNQAGGGLGNLTGTIAAGSGGFSGNGGSFNLADSGSQAFSYTVSPTAHGAISANIAVNTTDGSSDGMNNAQNLSPMLTATGVGPTLSTSLPANSMFSFISPQVPPELLTVANTTVDADLGALTNLDVLSATLSGTGASMFSLSGISPGTALAKSQSANLQISFTPTAGAAGSETATLTLVTDEGAANGSAGKTLTFSLAGTAAAAAAVWNAPVSGNWGDGTKWSTASAPNAAGAAAVLNKATTSALTVTLNTPETVGSLTLGNSASASVGYTLSGSNTLTMNNSGSNATITVSDGSHFINTPMTLADNVLITAPSGDANPWTLTFGAGGGISGSGKSLTLNSSNGRLFLSGSDSYSGTIVSAGTLTDMSVNGLAGGSNLTVGNSFASAPVVPTAAPTSVPVPEPETLLLLAAGVVAAATHYIARGKYSLRPIVNSVSVERTVFPEE